MFNIAINISEYVSDTKKRLQGNGISAVLVRGASGSFTISVINAGIVFGTNILLARVLGVTQYGIYIYALTWINLLAWACQLGLPTSLVRFVSAYNVKEEWSLFRGILNRSILYVLVSSTVIGGVSASVIWLLKNKIEFGQMATLYLGMLLLPLIALTALRQGTLRGLKRVVLASISDSIARPLILATLVIFWYLLVKVPLEAEQTMLLNFIATLSAFCLGSFLLYKNIPHYVRNVTPTYEGKEWLKVSFPLFFGSGMFLILRQADIVMIGILMGTKYAGIYAIVSRITGLVSFGKNSIDTIAAPIISELFSAQKRAQLQRIVTLSARGVFSFTTLSSLVLGFSGIYVLSLFGSEFQVGYTPLLFLLIGQVLKSLLGSAGFLMSMTGHHNQGAIIVTISAVVNIAMNYILIPKYGLLGAAIATAFTNILWSFTVLIYVINQLNINPTIFVRARSIIKN